MLNKPITPCSSCVYSTVTHHTKYGPSCRDMIGFCDVEGSPQLGVTFVAEASGENEEEDGLPLRPYAQAGSIHTRLLRSMYVSRKQVGMTNILACRPPDNDMSGPSGDSAIASCAPIRNARLAEFTRQAKASPLVHTPVTVALGDVAFRTLTGLNGTKQSISYARGYPIQTEAYGLVIGTYHPAFIRRNIKLYGVVDYDYRKAFRLAKEGFTPLPRSYCLRPSDSQVRNFRDRVLAASPEDWLLFDFETQDIKPNMPAGEWPALESVQFSLGPGTGIYLDLINGEDWELMRQIFASQVRKGTHNGWDFDVPLAAYHKIPVNGLVDDTMWMYHHYQPDVVMEDAGAEASEDFRFSTAASLQAVASFFGADSLWKHKRLSSYEQDRREYAVEDVDNTARILYGCLGYESLPSKMKALNIWDGYEKYVRDFSPILKSMSDRGIPINRAKQKSLDLELKSVEIDLDKTLQAIHPDELKKSDPKNGFVNEPKISGSVRLVASDPASAIQFEPFFEWFDDGAETEEVEDGDAKVTGVWRKMERRTFEARIKSKTDCGCLRAPEKGKGKKALGGKVANPECQLCGGKGVLVQEKDGKLDRWCRVLPFRPSNKQLLEYIRYRKHKVPFDRKLNRETTAAKSIERLAKKTNDPLYQGILDIRTVEKLRSTYLTGKGWFDQTKSWEDQSPRIHSTFSFGPATGQLSSSRPNVQNVVKHTRNENLKKLDLATRWRKLIEAKPGHRIWEFDLKSAHALTLGLEAKDKDYMRLARIDVHSYFASVMAGKQGYIQQPISLNLSDNDLTLALADFKKWTAPDGTKMKTIRDVKAKPAILGIGFGLMGKHLWELNPESFKDEFEAQNVIDMFYEVFPRLNNYKTKTMVEAHDKHYLVSRGGFIRWFHQIWDFVYDPFDANKYKTKHGADAEAANAFRPANTAFVYMRDAQLRLERMGVNQSAGFFNTIHDSNMFHIAFQLPDSTSDDMMAKTIQLEMERPQILLGDLDVAPSGLWIGCDAQVGRSWGEMEDIKL